MADERAVTLGEVLAMKLAETAGLQVAEARVVDSDGVPVALIRRFDRIEDGGSRLPTTSTRFPTGSANSRPGSPRRQGRRPPSRR
ncbi:MAG: HipA domain-containing protein [Myxococcota bacterium]|nr:HipA domain-containing protein [Myxococcota bacterium]